ncbi:TonB-dependent siderophore receptor [Brevundimonas sp. SL130]|uniref:TonB-dependent siderophore receptor n=1 Tax=Brevundimonas sp. SL130 TaxID=2995143 RepID=UPI00226CAC13|nr:TonB-dependent siderophore receptor [Brevundimonas sp. SL130]WAC59043.1 TonB-dependent siderophore receptor [Brevundimonas sp. SL130]
MRPQHAVSPIRSLRLSGPALSCSASALALVLAVASPALAQNASSTQSAPTGADAQEIDEIVVNAYRTAESVGAATKTQTTLIDTPQSVSVITRDELDARGVQTLNEATRYVAGVLPESSGMDNRIDDMYIRGFDAGGFASNVMLDGLRMPSDSSSSWNHASINTWNMQQVEVVKGPSSVLYGQLAPGGMVNQVSKTPVAGQAQVLQLSADANGKYQIAGDVGGGAADGQIQGRLVAFFKDGGTQLDHVDHQQWLVAPSVEFKAKDGDTRLTLLGLYQEDSGGSTFQFLPYQGSVIPAANGYIDNQTFLGEPNWNVYDRTVWSAGYQFEHRFSDALTLSQSARMMHVDSLYRATVVYGVRGQTVTNPNTLTDGRILPRRAVQGQGDSDGYAIDTRLAGVFSTGAFEHAVLAGFDWQQTDWTFLRKQASVSQTAIQIDVYDPVYTNYDFAPTLVNQVGTDETDRQTGVYLQDQIQSGKWRLTLGGRYDWANLDSLNTLTNVRVKTKNEAFSGRAGLLYAFDNGLSPYVSYSQSFQPTPGTARDGSAFEAITADQWEAGLKYEPQAIDGMITLSAYELRQDNVLTTDPLNTGAEAYQVQTGQVRIRGLELEGRVTPLEGLSLIGAGTLFDSEVTRDTTNQGNDMIRVPDWMGSFWADYTFDRGPAQGLSVAGGVRYVDSTYGDLANTLAIDSYQLFDAAVRYDLGQIGGAHAVLALNGSNLADKRYVATCSALTSCYYGTGRTLTASLKLSW